jgi:protoheme IX farnesyltransferase
VIAWRRYSGLRWVKRLLNITVLLMVVQIALGGVFALRSMTGEWNWMSPMHLGLSLIMLACLTVATVIVFDEDEITSQTYRLVYRSPFARLSLITLGALSLLLLSGAVLSGSQFATACTDWPLCNGSLIPSDYVGWVNLSHRLLVVLVSGLVGVLFIRAWRTQRTQPGVLVASTTVGVLFFAQAFMGARLVDGFPPYLLGLHSATAVASWVVLVTQVVFVGLAGRTREEEQAESKAVLGRKGLAKDLLMLTKPIVVALLLVTTFAGMVIGGEAWPKLSLTIWTLLGGFLAAGGSGAINQYIDRFDDFKMQRTQKRPIPAGRLTPAEGLAFGVGVSLASFFIMVAFVNFLAALLTLAGIIYYVLLYSIFLKKTTVQNIVIGGGAGAIPPLVGWAAATGSLNIPSLFLFAVVFMWTPPHFWALALVRRKDYARAGVPMLPVVRGERETRWQIFIYTIELVLLTLILPLFGLGGSLYFIGASMLGIWLLFAAWKVWKQGGNKLAWKMYRYSSMYLAFLFVILMVDSLL